MKKIFFLIIIFITIIIFIGIISPVSYSATSPTVTKHPALAGNNNQANVPLTGNTDHIYSVDGNLTISQNISGNRTGVIFVKGNLAIGPLPGNKLTHGTANSGLVFVVKGNVNIHKDVTQVDTVIISEGIICTAYDGTSCPPGNILTSQLVINGSLISLNPDQPIKFRRTLSDNSQPAEVINHQVKYLVILRDLLSDTWQKWSEIP